MKILVLNYEFPPIGGGGGAVSKDLAIQMAQRGHRVDVVTMGFQDLPEYEEIEGVGVYRVPCIRVSSSSCRPWEQLSYTVAAKKVLNELVIQNQYDLCHVHFIVPTAVLARYLKRKYGLRYIITAHGSDVEGHNSKKSNLIMHNCIRPLWKSLVKEAEAVIAPSNHLLSLMNQRYRGNYRIIPNGIDLGKFSENSAVKKEHRILSMGRLQSTKNVQALIHAAARTDMGDWKIDIVGDGPYRSELEHLAERLHMDGIISFHGWVANGSEEHLSLLGRASLYVSHSYFENFSVALLEAAAAGCAVLLSDIESYREVVDNEDCFTAVDDIDTLSKKITAFICGEKDFSIGRGTVEKYEWGHVADLYEKEYERVIVFDKGSI